MYTHRVFNADRFLDKFRGRESLLRDYVRMWNGRVGVQVDTLDVPRFKDYLVNGNGNGKEELLGELYRAYDLCSERGHEDLVAAARDCGYQPDPDLPVECLSLKVRTESEECFNLAYDRSMLKQAERFSVYRGREARAIDGASATLPRLQQRLGEAFEKSKASERVIVRQYEEEGCSNFIIHHERRTRSELIFDGAKTEPRLSPLVFRPSQQDFISYNRDTGQVEIESRFDLEEETLKRCFGECCLGDAGFFDGIAAADCLDLSRVADSDFCLPVDGEDRAALVELHFSLRQEGEPTFVIRSKDVLATMEVHGLRNKLAAGVIRRAVFKITFPGDRRGKRVELAGRNSIRFKRSTHAEEVFQYLKKWEILIV